MTISVGQSAPETTLFVMGDGGPEPVATKDLFAGQKVAVFGLPGAFTPTCSAKHLPGFIQNADDLAAKGINKIVCVSVNDAFVMGAWAKDQGAGDKVMVAGDGDAEFAKAAGLELDLNGKGFGLRCQRFSMVVDNGVVESLNLESDGGYEVTSAEYMLNSL
ncbi:MAG: peroxiredoxin [Rhodospirillales bacterium]|jgi:glutaredoxin/glutathione-dependent peroxiredoxin|nr:peroxiredoxin [Rhodospirillales bacterium]